MPLPVEGALPGFLQGMQDIEAVKQAPQKTRLITAQAGEAEIKYRREKMMMDAMQQYGIQGNTPSEKMRFMGNLAIDSGNAEEARKLFDSASMVDSRQAAAQASQARGRLIGSTLQMRNLDIQGRLLGQATDQKSWDAGNAYYFMLTGEMSPYAGRPYSKELTQQVQRDSMNTKDRITKELDERKTKSLESIRDWREKDIQSLIKYRERKLELERQRLDRLGKAGAGKGVKDPGRDLQTQAMRKIKEAYPDLGTDVETLTNSAYSIASEAQSLRQGNPALSSEEALGRAFKSAVERGDFKQTHGNRFPLMPLNIFDKTQTKYTGAGRTAETAVPLPQGADPSKLEKGHYYIDSGVTARWDPDDPDAEGGWVLPENEGASEEEEGMLEGAN